MVDRKRRAFTKEFKVEAVRIVRESGKTVGAVARELNFTERALRKRVRQARRLALSSSCTRGASWAWR